MEAELATLGRLFICAAVALLACVLAAGALNEPRL